MIGLWFLHSAIPLIALYHCIKFHLFIFNTFRDILWTSLLVQKLKREITLLLVIVTVLALCTSSDGHLSLYQVSFNSLLNFQRYAPDKLFIAKIKKGSNSVNTGDMAQGYGSYILQFPLWPSISVSSFIKLPSILLEICSGQV